MEHVDLASSVASEWPSIRVMSYNGPCELGVVKEKETHHCQCDIVVASCRILEHCNLNVSIVIKKTVVIFKMYRNNNIILVQ